MIEGALAPIVPAAPVQALAPFGEWGNPWLKELVGGEAEEIGNAVEVFQRDFAFSVREDLRQP